MLKKCNYCKELTRFNELMNYSSNHLLEVQRKISKHGRNVEEYSNQRTKLFKEEQSVSFTINWYELKLKK